MTSVSGSVYGGANGELIAFISRAKDLPNLRKLDKQNPYVILRIAHMTEKSDVVFRGGQTPTFAFQTKFDITPDVKPLLIVEVLDETKKAPKLVGKCEIDITPALYADPEEGYDDWHDLKLGREYAGKIYIELTFCPKLPPSQLRKEDHTADSFFESSIASRPAPPLPSDIPDINLTKSSGYTHASHMRQVIPSIQHYATPQRSPSSPLNQQVPSPSTLGKSFDFSSSVGTNATYESQVSQTTVGTTESPFARLKQLKEKWKNLKNQGTSEQHTEQRNGVDLEALQRAVGVDPDEHTHTITRLPSRATIISAKLQNQPPLPPLPHADSRRSSHSSPIRRGYEASSPHRSPKLPPLPMESPFSSRRTSMSPTRRRPPPPA